MGWYDDMIKTMKETSKRQKNKKTPEQKEREEKQKKTNEIIKNSSFGSVEAFDKFYKNVVNYCLNLRNSSNVSSLEVRKGWKMIDKLQNAPNILFERSKVADDYELWELKEWLNEM